MNSTRATNRSRRRSRAAALLAVAAVLAASCGDDDDGGADTADTADTAGTGGTADTATTSAPSTSPVVETTAPETTRPETTGAPTDGTEPAIGGDPREDCVYRPGELIATSGLREVVEAELERIAEELGVDLEVGVEETSLVPDEVIAQREPEDLLSLYQFGGGVDESVDPLAVAAALSGTPQEPGPMKAAPNYYVAFAQRWKYAPYDDPAAVDGPADTQDVPMGATDSPIAVVDTGYVAIEGSPAQRANVIPLVLQDVPGGVVPSPPDELLAGRVAGHGTFIVNILARLLDNPTIHAVTLPARVADDDEYRHATSPGTSVRDDSTITWALETLLMEDQVRVINLSGGSYGCTSVTGDAPEEYHQPLGLRQLMEVIEERNSSDGSDQIQVFAASGNDQQRPGGAIFYPAGWGPDYEWLHSVASDPAEDGTDYSNRGSWVEFQAAGSDVVSYLPETTRPPAGAASPLTLHAEGWYAWSGTSFATPCALAAYVTGAQPLEPASPDGSDPFTDCGINQRPGS